VTKALGIHTESQFRTGLRRDGFDEVLERSVAPGLVLDPHQHEWDSRLWVLRGQLELIDAAGSVHLSVGQACEVPAGHLHAERYGLDGCTVVVGRRRPSTSQAA